MFSLLLSVECYHAGIALPNNAGVNRAANCLSGDNRCGNLYGVCGVFASQTAYFLQS